MFDNITVILSILAVDVGNPVLLAAVILALTTSRPFGTSIALILGHTLAYFVVGALIVFGLADVLASSLAPLLDRFLNPSSLDYGVGLVVGLLLVVVAIRWKIHPPSEAPTPEDQPAQVSLLQAFFYGATVNFIGIPFALPYFAFINQLYKVDEDQRLFWLVIYNLLYALPFMLLPVAFAIGGKAVIPALKRINEIVEKYSAYILPGIIGLLGAVLTVDAILYFWSGRGLI